MLRTVHSCLQCGFLCSALFFILTFMDICSFSSFTFNCYTLFPCLNISIYPILFTDRFTDRLFPIIFYYERGCIKKPVYISLVHVTWSLLQLFNSVTVVWMWLWKWFGHDYILIKLYKNRQWAEFGMWVIVCTKVYISKSGIAWVTAHLKVY